MDMHVENKKYGNFVSISRLTGKCAAQKFKKTFVVLVYGHVYIIWSYQETKRKCSRCLIMHLFNGGHFEIGHNE